MTYEDSRMAFMAELMNQTSPITGENFYNEDGFVSRMLQREESKEVIESQLMKNSVFKANVEKLENQQDIDDPIEKYMIEEFSRFYETVKNLENPETSSDIKSYVLEMLTEAYPNTQNAQEAIKNDASPKEIFKLLEEDEKWKDDATNYTTRMDVELPTHDQKSLWSKIEDVKDHINDLSRYN